MGYKVLVNFNYSESTKTSMVIDVDRVITDFIKQVFSILDRGKGIWKCKYVLDTEFEEFLMRLHNKVDIKDAIGILKNANHVNIVESIDGLNMPTFDINLDTCRASIHSECGYYSCENKPFIALW